MSLAYFPMFPTDFDADTGHLTFAEDGAYNRLLRLSWRCPEAKMPDDLDWICRKARAVTEADRALIEAVLSEFFTRKGGKVFSARLHKEWNEANAAHAKRVLAGKNGGNAKAAKAKENMPSNATELPEQCPSNQNQNQNHKEKKVSSSEDTPRLALDSFNSAASRAGWPQVRTMTPARKSALKARLAEAGGIDGWTAAIRRAEASDFLSGRTDKAFRLTFDFITGQQNFAKLTEGNYDNRTKEVPHLRPVYSDEEQRRREDLFQRQLEKARAEYGN